MADSTVVAETQDSLERPPRPAQSAAAARVGGGVGVEAVLDEIDRVAQEQVMRGRPVSHTTASEPIGVRGGVITTREGDLCDMRDAIQRVTRDARARFAASDDAEPASDAVSAAHARLLDLVLSRKYSGDSLQKAIRSLIAAARDGGDAAYDPAATPTPAVAVARQATMDEADLLDWIAIAARGTADWLAVHVGHLKGCPVTEDTPCECGFDAAHGELMEVQRRVIAHMREVNTQGASEPTPAVADALARAERGDFVAVPAPLDERALDTISSTANQATADAHALIAKSEDDDPEPGAAECREMVSTLAAHIFALSDALGMVVEDRRTLAGQLARAEYQRDMSREAHADFMRHAVARENEWREENAALAAALSDVRARLAAAERVGERDEARRDVVEAAGELLLPVPEPGTAMAKLMSANVLIRSERERLADDLDAARARGESAGEVGGEDTVASHDMRELASRIDAHTKARRLARETKRLLWEAAVLLRGAADDMSALPARPSTPAAEGDRG